MFSFGGPTFKKRVTAHLSFGIRQKQRKNKQRCDWLCGSRVCYLEKGKKQIFLLCRWRFLWWFYWICRILRSRITQSKFSFACKVNEKSFHLFTCSQSMIGKKIMELAFPYLLSYKTIMVRTKMNNNLINRNSYIFIRRVMNDMCNSFGKSTVPTH